MNPAWFSEIFYHQLITHCDLYSINFYFVEGYISNTIRYKIHYEI